MENPRLKSLNAILQTHNVSKAFVEECFDAGLIHSRSIFSARDEVRVALANKGRSLGFSLSEIRVLIHNTKSIIVLVSALAASFFAIEIADPATIDAIADVKSFAQ